MPTQSQEICSHDIPRLSRSPLIRPHDGSAAAAAARKYAALSAPLEGLPEAFRIKAAALASSSNYLLQRRLVLRRDVSSRAAFGPTSRTSICSMLSEPFGNNSNALRKKTSDYINLRQVTPNAGACPTDPRQCTVNSV